MKNNKLSLAVVIIFVALMTGLQQMTASSPTAAERAGRQSKVNFVSEIQPIFQASCYSCHGPNRQMAGLRLDSKKIALGKVIVAGKSNESQLYQRVAGIGVQARMPMKGEPLNPEQVGLIRRWIDEGADWPEDDQSAIRNPQSNSTGRL
jgi:mono/diheme cytochrome c family protein